MLRELHRTIRKVSEDIPRLSYNTAIAALMAYMNVLRAGERRPHRMETEPVVQLIAPFAPHIAEELWERLGHDGSVFDGGWPAFDPALAAVPTVTVAIQVNGKLRATVVVAPDALEDDVYASAMADPAVARHITTPPRKRIYVPGRLMNLVAGG